jgi:hypothetical protein
VPKSAFQEKTEEAVFQDETRELCPCECKSDRLNTGHKGSSDLLGPGVALEEVPRGEPWTPDIHTRLFLLCHVDHFYQ